jgi:hypothetical protein
MYWWDTRAGRDPSKPLSDPILAVKTKHLKARVLRELAHSAAVESIFQLEGVRVSGDWTLWQQNYLGPWGDSASWPTPAGRYHATFSCGGDRNEGGMSASLHLESTEMGPTA